MIRVIRHSTTILICLAVLMQPLAGAASRCHCGGAYAPAGLPFNPSTSAVAVSSSDAIPSTVTPSTAVASSDEVAATGEPASPAGGTSCCAAESCCGTERTNASDVGRSGDHADERTAFGRIDRGCSCSGDDCRCHELERSPDPGSPAATVCRVADTEGGLGESSLAESRRPWDAIATFAAPRCLSPPDVPIRPASRQVTLCRWLL